MNEKDIDLFFKENENFVSIFATKDNAEGYREKIYEYLNKIEWDYRRGEIVNNKIEYSACLEAIKILKNIISPWNEKLSGFSTLKLILNIFKKENQDTISKAFFEEIKHLLQAINGKANYSKGWLGLILEKDNINAIDFNKAKGEDAGKLRSDYLDQLFLKINNYINQYPCGLDYELIKKRKKNVNTILCYFNANKDNWEDYHWQISNIIKGEEGLFHLKKLIPITSEEIKSIQIAVDNDIPFGITPYYLSLFDFERSDRKFDYQVRSQVIPPLYYVESMVKHRKDRRNYFDFMGEHDTSPAKLVTRRYPMISILKPFDTCPQICVYCQRNWEITGPMLPEGLAIKKDIDNALKWYKNHPAIIDILITGGDPLSMNDDLIKYIMDHLCEMEHIVNIRWASRTPVTLPMQINDSLVKLLSSYIEPGKRNVSIATHIESAAEITPELTEAIYKFRKEGMHVNNQMVYHVGISKRFQNVQARIAMRKIGVHPYYTFYPKGKKEHQDYLIPLARLLQESKEEARLLPGIFRGDEPVFNVPRLGKSHVRAWQDRELIGIDKDGCRIYLFHPWEKGISLVEPYLHKDVPIYDYLEKLKNLGEDIKNYETIWYYY